MALEIERKFLVDKKKMAGDCKTRRDSLPAGLFDQRK